MFPVRIWGALVALTAAIAWGEAAPNPYAPNGIKIGDGRLHPFFDFEGRYDSAAGFFNTGQLAGDIALRFRPGVRFELQNDNTAVNFNGNAEYVMFTGLLFSGARDASRFQTDVALDTAFNKLGAVEFQLGDNLTRSDRTNSPGLTVGVISLYNNAHVAVPIHPGGRAIEITPKFAWGVEFFEPLLGTPAGCAATDPLCQASQVSQLNYSNLSPGLAARWRFLPKTAVVFDSGVDLRTYFSGTVGKPATVFHASAGLSGLVTSKISVLATLGYAGEYQGTGLNTLIAQADLGFLPTEGTSIHLGYMRSVSPAPVFGAYGDDRGYLDAKALVFQRLTLGANVAFDYLTYYGTSGRKDTLLTGGVSTAFAFTSWLSAGAGYNLQLRGTNSASAGAAFTRHEVIVRLTLQY